MHVSKHPDRFKKIIRIFKERGIEAVYVDITNKEIKKYGFKVIKVVIPQLQPLYLNEKYAYLEKKRLNDASIAMGFSRGKIITKFNNIPHPFL